MQAFKKVGVIITLSALSLSSAWATDDSAFVAIAKNLDGFKAIPPVLTSTTDEVCLEFKTQGSTGEAVAQVLAGNPGARNKRPFNEDSNTDNIRLYLGQHFANGQPIATLCDNAIPDLKCDPTLFLDIFIDGVEYELLFFDFSDFRLSDIQFQRQQIEHGGLPLTIAGVTFPPPFVKGRLRLRDDDKRGLKLMKALIKQELIYVVENDEFEASERSGGIIEYKPPKRGTVRNGKIRDTLRLAPKASRCPPPPTDE